MLLEAFCGEEFRALGLRAGVLRRASWDLNLSQLGLRSIEPLDLKRLGCPCLVDIVRRFLGLTLCSAKRAALDTRKLPSQALNSCCL